MACVLAKPPAKPLSLKVTFSAAQQAFHYRSPTAPDEPYWDRGERLH